MSVVTNYIKGKKYSVKSVSVYASDEWMGGGTKKYRSGFDRAGLDYVRCEVAFFNKVRDRKPWTCAVEFRCFEITATGRTEIALVETEKEIPASEDVVFVREGWGSAERGTFWKQGKYTWEVIINGEKAGEAGFYVNDIGLVQVITNPYFTVKNLRFYSGDKEGSEQEKEKREYLSACKKSATAYVWAEVEIENKPSRAWQYE